MSDDNSTVSPSRQCEHCKAELAGSNPRKRFCGRSCERKYRRVTNPEWAKARDKRYHAKYAEKAAAASKKWVAANRDKIHGYNKAQYHKDIDKRKAAGRAYYLANKEDINAKQKKHYDANAERMRAVSKSYRDSNPELVKARKKADREKNLEKHKARDRAYAKANAEKRKRSMKKWYEENATEVSRKGKGYYTANKQAILARNKKWREENPDKADLIGRRKRMRKSGVRQEPYTKTSIFVRDGYRCWICGKLTNKSEKFPHPDSPSIDHVIPISKGGDDAPYNVSCACLGCNLSKKDKVITLF